jgi:nicotinamidase-related amidase
MMQKVDGANSALLMIDVINDLEFPGGEKVLPWAERLAPKLKTLRRQAHAEKVPVIYANDNYGLWHESTEGVIKYCSRPEARGSLITKNLAPTTKDYFIIKPRHSAFFSSSLKPLLDELGIKKLILTGIATNLCVLFSAHDAHMHGYKITVVSDCCAAESDADHNIALNQLKRFCDASICLSSDLNFGRAKHRQNIKRRSGGARRHRT